MANSILEQLQANDVKVMHLAKRLGVSRQVVYQSIAGNGSRDLRVAIAKHLNSKPSALWVENDKKSLRLDDALFSHNDGDVA